MHKTIWTRKMLATLRRLYPHNPLLATSVTYWIVGTCAKKAHELGLERDRFKLSKAYYGRYSRNKEGDTKKARS